MEQFELLDKLIKTLDSLLEVILFTQFGIEDKKWIDAIKTIEDGYAKAKNFINTKLNM